MILPRQINVHSIIEASRVNGPGRRLVVFFQGCARKCKGCFNPSTHSTDEKLLYYPDELFKQHLRNDIWGLTISGGEPFLQPAALTELLKYARSHHGLSIVVFTGYLYEELTRNKELREPLNYIDVLIDGPYKAELNEPTLLARGSTNQNMHFLTDTYSLHDFYMPGRSELIIQKDGGIIETGFSGICTSKNLF